MPKIDDPTDKEQVPTSPEPVRLTRAAAKRLGSVDRDTPTTPKRSNSSMSLDVISEDSFSSMRGTRATKRASPLSPISEKENSKTGTPVRRSRRASVAADADSPVPQSFRTLRRQNKDVSDTEGSSSTATTTSNPNQPRMTRQRTTSKLTQQNVENLNGKSPKSVTFCESPEREKDLMQFPKTPIAGKRKSAEGEQPDTSFESISSDKVAVVCLERLTSFNISEEQPDKTVIEVEKAQESEKGSDEVVEDDAVRQEVAETEKNAEEVDKAGEEVEGGEKMTEESAGSAQAPEFSSSWSQAVSGKQSNETPIDAFGEKERKEEEDKLKEHAEKVAKKDVLYSLVKVFSDDDEEEEQEDEEEEKKDKSEFIDDEAVEVSSDNESMDPEEREYLNQQEIPEQGIEIGSEDSDTDQEDDDEVLSEDRDFIAFSDPENTDGEEDSLDKLTKGSEKVDEKGKKIRRRIIVQDTSSDGEDDEVEAPAEKFANTELVKFSGTMLREMLEETQAEDDRAVIEADFDEDVVMESPASPEKQKKTPQKTPEKKSLSRDLEADFHQSPEKDSMPKEPEKPEEMDQDEPPGNEAEPDMGDNSQSWEDIEEEEENGSQENSNISAVMARCSEFLQKQRDAKTAQRQINMEKKAKKKAAKERKKQLKKEEEEKRAERERLKEELKEQKKREKEAEDNQLKNEKIEEKQKEIPVIPAKSQKSKSDKKKLPAEDVFQFQGVQPSEKKAKKDKPQKILSQEVKESVPETIVKKKKKREMEESLAEIQEKPPKKKKLPVDEPTETSLSSSKRLPESLLNKLSASEEASKKVEGKKKRRAEEDLERPQKKKKQKNIPESPQLINTPAGWFTVEPVQPMKNPFSIQDAKLLKKSLVTKQFEREKRLKRKKPIQEPSAVFPRPMTSWSAAGIFTITDLQPQTRVVEGGGGVSMEFVVKTLEPKRKLGKKSSATSVFDSEAKKPVKGFKEAKLYGNGIVRESSTDLMHRKIKKKFAHK